METSCLIIDTKLINLIHLNGSKMNEYLCTCKIESFIELVTFYLGYRYIRLGRTFNKK